MTDTTPESHQSEELMSNRRTPSLRTALSPSGRAAFDRQAQRDADFLRAARDREYDRGQATSAQQARIDATAKTLRYCAALVFVQDEVMASGLYEAAKSIEDIADPSSWWCCPVCEEVTCDEGCPLEPIRAEALLDD